MHLEHKFLALQFSNLIQNKCTTKDFLSIFEAGNVIFHENSRKFPGKFSKRTLTSAAEKAELHFCTKTSWWLFYRASDFLEIIILKNAYRALCWDFPNASFKSKFSHFSIFILWNIHLIFFVQKNSEKIQRIFISMYMYSRMYKSSCGTAARKSVHKRILIQLKANRRYFSQKFHRNFARISPLSLACTSITVQRNRNRKTSEVS